MQRVTLTLDDDLVAEVDKLIRAGGYQSRSEAFRDVVRAGFQQLASDGQTADKVCVAALVYVYDHDVRELAKRLAEVRADNHHMMVATTSVDLDHKSCLEVALLRGETEAVRHLGTHVISERGVRHGKLVVVPVEVERESHRHGSGKPHAHDHFRVRNSS